jgi:hypothetical protein
MLGKPSLTAPTRNSWVNDPVARRLRRGVIASAILAALAFGTARADDIAYVGVNGGNFGTVDLETGAFADLGNSGQTLAGLAVANSTLFATSYHVGDSSLYSVNPSNGQLTSIGTTGVDVDDFGSTTTGLYAVDTSGNLDSINRATGAATVIGNIGISLGSWRSLSTNSNTLYFSNGANLYSLSTTTGAATLIGATGGPEMGALLFENGKLYGGEETPTLAVATLNITSGAATTGAGFTGSGSGQFFALAPNPIPSVPEPATWLLTLFGACAIGGLARKRSALSPSSG